jgi:biopolymer transport protein ExbD
VGEILASKLAQNPTMIIALHADARVSYATVSRMLDQLQQAHAPRVVFAAEKRSVP